MALLSSGEIINLGLIFAGFLVVNFISIHSMANLILYEGSSRRKSLNISAQFALLSTTFALVGILFLNIFGNLENLGNLIKVLIVLSSYALIVEVFRIWFIRREYETTLLNAFLVAEGLTILLQGAFLVLREAILLWI